MSAPGQESSYVVSACAWAGDGATLVVVDPGAARAYVRDFGEQGGEQIVGTIAHDDPRIRPVIGVSPDGQRLAILTRRVADDGMAYLDIVARPEGDGGPWQIAALTCLPAAGLRVLPFWSANGASLAFLIVDSDAVETLIVAVTADGGQGAVFYSSSSVDPLVAPASHPDGRLIAMVRDQPLEDEADEDAGVVAGARTGKRVVLVDPVEQAIAPLPPDAADVQALRWVDAQTLLVEAGASAWTVELQLSMELAQDDPATQD